ncbi:MAG: S-layer protein, partial [Pirellulales bacterium]
MNKFLPLTSILILSFSILLTAQEDKTTPPGLGDPGLLQSIDIDNVAENETTIISGRDAGLQLIVTGAYDSGQQRDLTRDVVYSGVPAGLVDISSSGFVSPVSEGAVVITAKSDGKFVTTVSIQVTDIVTDLAVNFPNEISPVFTKFGCNGGGCHGKSSGQNGFRLSLLGFEPDEDYEYLVKEGRGRRIFPAAPQRSLLLQKAIGVVPHGGGARLSEDSPSYRLLSRWIEQGMPYGQPEDATVTSIIVLPEERLMQRNGEQQISVFANYSDGTIRDVTRTTAFDSNSTEMAEVNQTGLVTTSQLTG